MSAYLLAVKLDDFSDEWDPYGYDDAFSDRTEGIESFMVGLMDDTDSIINWLKEIVATCEEDEHPYWNDFHDKANELIKEVKEWTSKI